VLDASVVVKWLLDEPGRDPAIAILEEVVERPRRFAVPSLVWYELTHVLIRAAKDREAAFRALAKVTHLGIPSFAPTAERCERAMKLATRLGLSGYDAHYVSLAEELEGRWVTFDDKAARRVTPRSRVQCLS